MRRPDDPNPDPPGGRSGGRSAERLREFVDTHKAPDADPPANEAEEDEEEPLKP